MRNQCGWIELAGDAVQRPALQQNIQADWLIIGAGYAGLSCAHHLALLHPQAHIVVVDRQRAGQGASARNSGFVVAHEIPEAGEAIGEPRHAYYLDQCAIARAGVAHLKSLIEGLQIDCDLHQCGYYFASHQPIPPQLLHKWQATLQAGGASTQLLDAQALTHSLGTPFYRSALWSGNGNAFLQPARYVKGLLDSLPSNVSLFENTDITGIAALPGGGGKAGSARGSVSAPKVVVTLNAFFARLGIKRDRVFPLELSASLTRPLTTEELQLIGNPQPWAVLSAPQHGATVRLTPDNRVMVRNTVDFRRRDTRAAELPQRRALHATGLTRRFAFLGAQDIDYTWTGNVAMTRNGQPLLGQIRPGIFAAGGCNASGVVRATLWGKLIAEYASGGQSETLSLQLKHAKPSWIPPRPIMDVAAAWVLYRSRQQARLEL